MLNKQKFISGFLTAKGIVTPEQLQIAQQTQVRLPERIDEIFKKMNVVCDENVSELIVQELGLSFLDLAKISVSADILETINSFFANRFRVFPLQWKEERLLIAFDNPFNFLSLEYFSENLGIPLEAELIEKKQMDELLSKYYPVASGVIALPQAEQISEEELPPEYEAPVIQMVNMLISDAYKQRASDIHIEPMFDSLRIRYRIDGILRQMQSPDKKLQASLISRIKLMAGMNIAEKRLPQDGRIRTIVDTKEFDLRISTLPAHYGESVVLRILDKRVIRTEELGFSQSQEGAFKKIAALPNGIILVTGPTGSGKSTTLYAVLSSIDRAKKKILTVEDPVEYQISGINQVQVKTKIGLTFEMVLRSMLRQAPDIIMVGEIRDLETARISVQSALTGHLIFSTLHTNDAPSAIARLVDMGIKPYLVAATLQAVLAQRLIRLLCHECKQPYKPPKDEVKILELSEQDEEIVIYKAVGCPKCFQTGYLGRIGIFELLIMDENIRQLTHQYAPSTVLREKARSAGMITLKEHAKEKVISGLTTFQELVRVTQSDVD